MTLKERLREHYTENAADFDLEETENVLEVLEECDDDLSDATKWDLVLLGRMINNDQELSNEIQELEDSLPSSNNENPFD